jgi:CDP-diacylglycerol--glycerol-3-phosphate 3-phosphatidyltransferase
LIPAWFLVIIILKLIEFFKTSDETLVYEKFGHFVALMFYAFPVVAILINNKTIVLILSIFITICALISSLSRIHQKFY